MRILWHNTFCLPYITSEDHIIKIVTYLYSKIINTNPDIICLCEVFTQDTKDKLLKYLLHYTDTYINVKFYEENNWIITSSGLMLLCKPNIVFKSIQFYPFKTCRMSDCLSSKGYLLLNFDQLQIIFTHMQNYDEGFFVKSFDVCYAQLKSILRSTNEKSLIIGDFNLEIDIMKTLISKNKFTIKAPNLSTCTDNKILDYALCTNNISQNISTKILDNYNNPSDHRMILITTSKNDINFIPRENFTYIAKPKLNVYTWKNYKFLFITILILILIIYKLFN